jgi:hypothetical protein
MSAPTNGYGGSADIERSRGLPALPFDGGAFGPSQQQATNDFARAPLGRARQAVRMAKSGDPSSFRNWLVRVYGPENVPDDELNAPMLRWLRAYFDVAGPVPNKTAWEALLAYQMELANDASVTVLDDVHRTTALRPVIVVEDNDGFGVRISVNGGYTAPSMWELDRPQAFAEVADYIQGELASELGCWPVCERHNLGLHAEVRDGIAVWWCRRMQHSVAPVGSLGLAKTRRAKRNVRRP